MIEFLRRKKLLKSRFAVFLAFVLVGTLLSGCGAPGILRAEAAGTTESKSESEDESAADAKADVKSTDDGNQIRLEYDSGGDTPTTATVIFYLDKGIVEVSALVSSMYEISYETTYSMVDNLLAIDTVNEITATDISGVAKVIGLPETLTAAVFHTVADRDGVTMLTIQFGDPEMPEEASLCCEAELEADVLERLSAAIADVRELLHMEYASEKENEDSSQTTADIRFYSNGSCTLSGCINSLYQWEYSTRWEFDNILVIEDPEVLKLSVAEDAKAFAERMGLETEYEISAQNKISLEDDQLLVTVDAVTADENDLLRHILTEDIHPDKENPDEEEELLKFEPADVTDLPRMAEFKLAEEDAQSLGFSLDDITLVDLEGISFTETEIAIMPGDTKTLEVVFKPENATNKNLKWTSENPGVAAVDAKGTVTGKAEGQTKITAISEDGGFEAFCTVDVISITPPSKPQASVSGEVLFTVYSGDSSITFYGNGQCAVNATHYEHASAGDWPFYASYTTRYDFSGDQLVIYGVTASVVDGIGLLPNMPMPMNHAVTMTGGGATITISASGKGFGTYSLSAAQVTQLKEIAGLVEKPDTVAVESVSLNETALTLEPGAVFTLTATVAPAEAANQKVLWSTSDESVAAVSDGQVQAVGEGTAVITVTTEDGGKTADCTVTVSKKSEQDPGPEDISDITLTYDDQNGDLATRTTVEFHTAAKTVKVSALASGMYQLDYETTFSIVDNKLTIASAAGVTAKDITGVAPLLGLPETLTGDVTHTVSGSGDAMTLTVTFADSLLGEFTLTVDDQKKLGLDTEAGQDTDVTLSYDDEKGDLATRATAVFNPAAKTMKVSALVSGMYQLDYETTFSIVDNKLTIASATGVTATDITGVAPLLGLPETITGDVIHTVSGSGDAMTLSAMFGDTLLGEFKLTVDDQKTLGLDSESETGGDKPDDNKPDEELSGDITLNYDDGKGDLATKTTAVFLLSSKTVKVNALASGMYQLTYDTTYSVNDQQLTIAPAVGVTAEDITGIAPLLGLPATMTGDVVHTITRSGDQVTLTVMFGDALLGTFTLDLDAQAKLGISVEAGRDAAEILPETDALSNLSETETENSIAEPAANTMTEEERTAMREDANSESADATGEANADSTAETTTDEASAESAAETTTDDANAEGIAETIDEANSESAAETTTDDANADSIAETTDEANSESAPETTTDDANTEPALESVEAAVASDSDKTESNTESICITDITLTRNEFTLEAEQTVKLKTIIASAPEDAQKMTWKSSDENVVKVVNDELRAVGEGTATITITAKDSEKTAVCKITVNKKAEPASPEENNAPAADIVENSKASEPQSSETDVTKPLDSTPAETAKPETVQSTDENLLQPEA